MYYEPLQDDEPSYAEQYRRAVERGARFRRTGIEEEKPSRRKVDWRPKHVPVPEKLAEALSRPEKLPRLVVDPSAASEAIEINRPYVGFNTIVWAVCEVYAIERDMLLGDRRFQNVTEARQIAVWLVKELTTLSLASIGRRFGRDHTTVLYSVRKVQGWVTDNDEHGKIAASLLAKLRSALQSSVHVDSGAKLGETQRISNEMSGNNLWTDFLSADESATNERAGSVFEAPAGPKD